MVPDCVSVCVGGLRAVDGVHVTRVGDGHNAVAAHGRHRVGLGLLLERRAELIGLLLLPAIEATDKELLGVDVRPVQETIGA